MADNARLAEWLRERVELVKMPVAKAIYEGLRMRVERGDFDSAGSDGVRDAGPTGARHDQ